MEYRKLPHGDEQISIIGMGNSSLGASGEEEAEKTVTMRWKTASITSTWPPGMLRLSRLMAGQYPVAGIRCTFKSISAQITAVENTAGH